MTALQNPVNGRIELPDGYTALHIGKEVTIYSNEAPYECIYDGPSKTILHLAAAMGFHAIEALKAADNAQPAAQPQGAVDKDGKPLTKTFRETVVARMMRDEAFCHAILDEQAEQIAAADIAASQTAEAMAVIAELVAALQYAVDMYGKPGGPWNVPGNPGGWIMRAKDALAAHEKLKAA